MTHDLHWLQQGTQQGSLTRPFTHRMHCLGTQRPHWLGTTYHHKGLKQVVIRVSGFHVLRTVLLFSAVFGIRPKQLSKLSKKPKFYSFYPMQKRKTKKTFIVECCVKALKKLLQWIWVQSHLYFFESLQGQYKFHSSFSFVNIKFFYFTLLNPSFMSEGLRGVRFSLASNSTFNRWDSQKSQFTVKTSLMFPNKCSVSIC